MNIRDSEKLILMMLCDLHSHLKVQSDLDPEFIKSAILEDQTWAFPWKYGALNLTDNPSPQVKHVCKHLDMFSTLKTSYEQLSKTEKDRIKSEAAPFGNNVDFSGYDGNNESEYMGIARFLTEKLNRYTNIKNEAVKNSHAPLITLYDRMYQEYEHRSKNSSLGPDAIIAILKARNNP